MHCASPALFGRWLSACRCGFFAPCHLLLGELFFELGLVLGLWAQLEFSALVDGLLPSSPAIACFSLLDGCLPFERPDFIIAVIIGLHLRVALGEIYHLLCGLACGNGRLLISCTLFTPLLLR